MNDVMIFDALGMGPGLGTCHRLQPQSHHHATYSGGSICVSGLSVQEDTKCSTELLILVDVPVKVACRSTTATEPSVKLLLVEVYVKVAWRSTRAKTAGTELSLCYQDK